MAIDSKFPGRGGAAWGGITGTLADQTDLQSALDAKATGDQAVSTTSDVEFLSVTTDSLEAAGAEIVVGSVIKFMTDVNLNGVNVATGSATIGATGDRLDDLWTDSLNGVNISAGLAVQNTAVAFTSVTVPNGGSFKSADAAGGGNVNLDAGQSTSGVGNDVQITASAGFDDLVTPQPGGNIILNPGPGVNGGADGVVFLSGTLAAPRIASFPADTITAGLSVYDVNGTAYRDFLVWTSGNAPAVAMTIPTTGTLTIAATSLTTLGGATFHTTSSALTDGAGASAGTLGNAPSIGNPTKWIGINDNGTTRYIPAW